jgi:hypothetical protein
MKRRSLILFLTVLIALAIPVTVFAQEYSFSLDRMVVDVYWNSDGTMSLEYLLTFTNQPNGHVIEFVDVGMPVASFDFNSIQASINGVPLSVSRDFQGSGGYGFAVEMGAYAIPPGKSGTLRVYVGRVTDVLYRDDEDAEYVSAVFAPLYFQSSVISGTTDIQVTYHLPPGVQPQEPRWHSAPSGFPAEPQTAFDSEGRITYTWRNKSATANQSYLFGASFPKKYVPAGSIVTIKAPSIPVDAIFNLLCVGLFVMLFLLVPAVNVIAENRRKLQYIPPRIAIEGHGIKRGLTAVEAAILMGEPLDKVMTMILFGLIKKGAASVIKREPLTIQPANPLPEGLHEYEKQFLSAFEYSKMSERRQALQNMTIDLVRSVSEKMRGFSRRETIAYYKNIMEKAWQQVEQADTPAVQGQLLDKNLEWTMLDRNYDDRARRVLRGPVMAPTWWGRYDPTFRRSAPASTGGSTPSLSLPSAPHLPGSDFASSLANGVQTFSQKVIGNVTEFTSRVTKVTNPPPPPPKYTGGSRGSGGGSSCACACACAGCACACAGGGR